MVILAQSSKPEDSLDLKRNWKIICFKNKTIYTPKNTVRKGCDMLRTQLKGDAKLPDEQRPQCPLLHGGLELEDLGGNVPAAPLWPN